MEVVDEVYGYDNEQKAYDATVALTTKYPDLGGIYAPTCPGLPAVARALEAMNKGHGAIKISGLCVPSITAKYMLDGTIETGSKGGQQLQVLHFASYTINMDQFSSPARYTLRKLNERYLSELFWPPEEGVSQKIRDQFFA